MAHAHLRALATEKIGEGATALDYAESWILSGGNIRQLARVIEKASGVEISRETVRQAIYQDEKDEGEAERRLNLARARGAEALMEGAAEVVEHVDVSRDAIAKAKLQADMRARLARAYDPKTWGDAPSVAIQINAHGLHLDALRRHDLTQEMMNPPRLAEVEAAQVLSIASGEEEAGPEHSAQLSLPW